MPTVMACVVAVPVNVSLEEFVSHTWVATFGLTVNTARALERNVMLEPEEMVTTRVDPLLTKESTVAPLST